MIFVTILYLIFKKKPEKFTESENQCSSVNERPSENISSDELSDVRVRTTAYNFNTSWCGFSRQFQPTWDKLNEDNNDSEVDIIDVKCDDENNQDAKKLCQKYPVRGYPTVLFVKGDNIVEYSGDRTLKDLKDSLDNFKN